MLDKRLTSYYCLSNYLNIARTLSFQNMPFGTPKDAFFSMLYNGKDSPVIKQINKQLETLEQEMQKKSLSDKQRTMLELQKEALLFDCFQTRLNLIDEETGVIKQIEILYSKVQIEIIKEFLDAFTIMVIDPSEENIQQLKTCTHKIEENQILESLWEEIKI